MAASSLQILVVDDNPADQVIIRESLRDALATAPDVTAAETLNSALSMIDANRALDAILLDLTLPDSMGVNSVQRVHERAPAIPIIVLTGVEDGETETKAIHSGAQDYLVKGSMDGPLMRRVIDHAIERQRLMSHLEEFDRLKSEFLATASHEMRTPLTVLRENTSLIADGICGPITQEQREHLEIVLRHCDRLGSLLNNLLDLQKINAGGIRIHRTRTDIAAILNRVHEDWEQLCAGKQQVLIMDVAADLPDVLADGDQIMQALVNLVGNAYKFTPEKGALTISAQLRDDRVEIAVQDSGIGIRADDIEAIFEAFRQSERKDGPGARGTGLGLTITKKIMQMHGGDVRVESEYGNGSKFTIELPVWDEKAELTALMHDRAHEAETNGLGCSVLLLRGSEHGGRSALDRAVASARSIFRSSDYGVTLTQTGIAVFVFDCAPEGVVSAVERLALQGAADIGELDFFIQELDDAPQLCESILANSIAWKPGSSLMR